MFAKYALWVVYDFKSLRVASPWQFAAVVCPLVKPLLYYYPPLLNPCCIIPPWKPSIGWRALNRTKGHRVPMLGWHALNRTKDHRAPRIGWHALNRTKDHRAPSIEWHALNRTKDHRAPSIGWCFITYEPITMQISVKLFILMIQFAYWTSFYT
jgi:hypothetical protein